jgi:inosose dehydratase
MAGKAVNPNPPYNKLKVGIAPDSWGIWFPDDPEQMAPMQVLDEMAEAGYEYLETGPFGFFPTDPKKLVEETSKRGITVIAGTRWGLLHKPEAWAQTEKDFRESAEVLKAVGAHYIVYLPPMYTDEHTGEFTDDHILTPEQRKLYTDNANKLGKIMKDEYDVTMVVHPHGDSHIQTMEDIDWFFANTDPEYVSFCLDTGHIVYGGGDSVEIINRYPDRIGFVHIKSMDPAIVNKAHADGWSFSEAVRQGCCVTPPAGEPDYRKIIDALAGLDREIYVVVEQDMYPAPADKPLPIAITTREFLADCGAGVK